MSSFGINTKVFFGEEKENDLYGFLRHADFKKIKPIIDSALADSLTVKKILQGFEQQGYDILEPVYYAAVKEPSYNQLDEFAMKFENDFDLLLAIGGGTTLDIAKGVSILLKNPGRGIDYRGMHKVNNPPVPLIVYPSTAGTGSEATWTAAFTDEVEGRKLGINGKNVAPLCGVLEPALIASCPSSVLLSAGLDAMVHAIEAVSAKTATLITITLGAKAFALLYRYLPLCLKQVTTMDAFEQIQIAAYLAGIAMMNAGGGPASGISYPLGVHYSVPHGFAGGVFLPDVFAMNIAKGYMGYNEVYDLLHDANLALSPIEKANDFLKKFNVFYDSIGAPRTVQRWQCMGKKAIEHLTALTLEQRVENLKLNPVLFERDDVVNLLERVCIT